MLSISHTMMTMSSTMVCKVEKKIKNSIRSFQLYFKLYMSGESVCIDCVRPNVGGSVSDTRMHGG